MAGIQQSSATVLKFLRSLFNDQTDELLVIKELLQNADDSGAQRVALGCSAGLPDAEHPLLKGPALFSVNDGPFSPADARAIITLGLSTKGGEASTVGKFGLGLKSAFYLAEALFFMDARRSPDESRPDEVWRHPHFDVLSPWIGSDDPYRPDWVQFSRADRHRILEHLRGLGLPEGFVVWIPLRREADCRKEGVAQPAVIVKQYPGDRTFELPRRIQDDISLMLPMMAHVGEIVIKPSPDAQAPLRTYRRLGPGRTADLKAQPFQKILGGDVTNCDGQPTSWYVGTETLGATPGLDELGVSPFWPTTEVATEFGEDYRKDPSVPHGAVVWQRTPSSSPDFEAHWSVFLPVERMGSAAEPLPGQDSYRLTLHGYFFLRPDRKSIYGLHQLVAANTASEEWIREQWNTRLAEATILPHVLGGLSIITAEATDQEIQALTTVLSRSPLGQRYHGDLIRHHQWARVIRDGAFQWALLPSVAETLPIPATLQVIGQAAALEQLGSPALFRDADTPCFVTQKRRLWPSDLLDTLLKNYGLRAVLVSPELTALFLDLQPYLPVAERRSVLVKWFREALLDLGFQALHKQREMIGTFLHAYLGDWLLGLPASDVSEALGERLTLLDLEVLLVPDGFAPRQPRNKWGVLNGKQATALLDCIQEAGDIAPVLGFVERYLHDDEDLEALVMDRPLLPTNKGSEGHGRWLTVTEARELAASSLIFRQQREQTGLLTHLADVLGEATLHFVPGNILNILGIDQQTIPQLTIKATLDTLRAVDVLGDEPARLKLVQKILEQSSSVLDATVDRSVLRRLLHGRPDHPEDAEQTLIVSNAPKGLWSRVARLASAHTQTAWTVIHSRVDFLNPKAMARLKVAEANVETVSPLLQSAGASFPGAELSEADREQLILELDDDVLRTLPIFPTTTGELTAITDGVYLEGGVSAETLVGNMTLIRGSKDKKVQERLKQLAPPLTHRAVWQLIQNEPEPWKHWTVLLEALRNIGAIKPNGSTDLPWIPLAQGGGVPPKNLLIFGTEDKAAALKQLRDVSGLDLSVQEDLSPTFPRNFEAHLQRLLATQEEQLRRVQELVVRARPYHVGSVSAPPETWLKAFEGVPVADLPLLGLLQAFEAPSDQQEVLKAASRPVSLERLLWMLGHLYENVSSKGQEVRAAAEQIYPMLLRDLRAQNVAPDVLAGLHLQSQAGTWHKAEELVASGPQFDPRAVLCTEQADALYGSVLQEATGFPAVQGAVDDVENKGQLARGVKSLQRHLKEWEQTPVPREQLGAFLALLDGNSMLHQAAEPYLNNFAVEVLRENAFGDVPRAQLPREFESYQAMHDQVRLVITLHQGEMTWAPNLLGAPIEVAFKSDQELTSLFTNDPRIRPYRDGDVYFYPVTLKSVDTRSDDIDYGKLLLDSLLWVLKHHIGIIPPQVQAQFAKVVDSGQATLAATQNRLIKAASQTWGRQLGVSEGSKILELLQKIEVEDRSAEQARVKKADRVEAKAVAKIRVLQDELKQFVEEDAGAQQELLRGVRRKITDMQYAPGSVPFELLQNADDALSEWQEMTGTLDAGRDLFTAESDQGIWRFIHYGRPINFFSSGDFDGRRRGFDGDLEKMLTLLSSDKRSGVTGKFGLGFKSVFLVSDRPTVKSDRLAFTVVGGVYPVFPDAEHVAQLRAILDQTVAPNGFEATLIELPLLDADRVSPAFDQFSRLAPFALAFTRSIRRLQLKNGEGTRHLRWHEEPLRPAVTVMRLRGDLNEWSGLALHSSDFRLILPLGKRGFAGLDSAVPNLWVMAPTEEKLGLPFLLHAAFPLDTGRAQLARNEIRLQELADTLRPQLQDALGQAFDLAQGPGLPAQLGWPEEVDLTAALWATLAEPFDREDSNPAFTLVKDLLWGEEGAYRTLSLTRPLIPNGLPTPYGALLKLHQAGTRVLGFPPLLLKHFSQHPAFGRTYAVGSLLSPKTARVLTGLGVDTPQEELTIFEVLTTLLPEQRVSPDYARWLEPILIDDRINELREDEDAALWLDGLRFQSRAQADVCSHDLLMAGGEGDEAARFGFAPAAAQLSAKYDPAGLLLFRRLRVEARTDQTANWLRTAQGEGRTAALNYIANQTPSGPLLEGLRQSLAASWLEHTQLITLPEWKQLSATQQQDVLNALRQPALPFPPAAPPSPLPVTPEVPEDDEQEEPGMYLPADFLQRVLKWWQAEGVTEARRYNVRLYPDGIPFVQGSDYDRTRADHRKAWLSLLMLGSLQSMGRTSPEAHRNFLSLCRSRGWLDTFSTQGAADERWMDSLRGYLTGHAEVLEYFQWMRGFASFYQLGRWLDEYVEVLLQADRTGSRSLRMLLAPGVNPDWQGSGLDAPPLTRTLGMGGPFVLRELLRGGALNNADLASLAYVPIRRLRHLMSTLMLRPLPENDVEAASRSIHHYLVQRVGEAPARFNGHYDLPFHILLGTDKNDTAALALQQKVLGQPIFRTVR